MTNIKPKKILFNKNFLNNNVVSKKNNISVGKAISALALGSAFPLVALAYKKGLFYRIIGTNAVYHEDLLKREWYISTNVSGLFANVITRLHHGQSLSDLLDNRSIIDKMIKASKNEKGNDSTER